MCWICQLRERGWLMTSRKWRSSTASACGECSWRKACKTVAGCRGPRLSPASRRSRCSTGAGCCVLPSMWLQTTSHSGRCMVPGAMGGWNLAPQEEVLIRLSESHTLIACHGTAPSSSVGRAVSNAKLALNPRGSLYLFTDIAAVGKFN